MAAIDPLTAGGVVLATAATDAVYVMFTSAVVARERVPAATWSSVWYLLSSYRRDQLHGKLVYVVFAAVGSWLGAFATHHLPAPPARRAAGRRVGGVREFDSWLCHPEARPCGRGSRMNHVIRHPSRSRRRRGCPVMKPA